MLKKAWILARRDALFQCSMFELAAEPALRETKDNYLLDQSVSADIQKYTFFVCEMEEKST